MTQIYVPSNLVFVAAVARIPGGMSAVLNRNRIDLDEVRQRHRVHFNITTAALSVSRDVHKLDEDSGKYVNNISRSQSKTMDPERSEYIWRRVEEVLQKLPKKDHVIARALVEIIFTSSDVLSPAEMTAHVNLSEGSKYTISEISSVLLGFRELGTELFSFLCAEESF